MSDGNTDVIELEKADPGLRSVRVAIGWDAPEKTGGGAYDLDIDASVFVLTRQNHVRFDQDFIFYNNLKSIDGHIVHSGDNRDGFGDGDDEMIELDLPQLSFDIEKIVFTISIHNAEERFQSFKDVQSGFIRVMNAESGNEIVRFDLSPEETQAIAYKCAEMVRNDNGGWTFRRLLEPHDKGLYGIAHDYGVNVAEP